jgi:hypothetical protein
MFGTAGGLTKLAALGLIAVMALGSVALWIGIPLGWIWLASRVANSSQPSMGPYAMIIVGIPVSMIVVGRFLSNVNRVYIRVTDSAPNVHIPLPWLRSMSGERDVRYPLTMLDIVMIISVAIALVAMAIWFFFFAGSPLPQ